MLWDTGPLIKTTNYKNQALLKRQLLYYLFDTFITVNNTVSSADKLYYGITKFKVQKQQTIIINIKESTKQDILKAISNNQLDDIKRNFPQRLRKQWLLKMKICSYRITISLIKIFFTKVSTNEL